MKFAPEFLNLMKRFPWRKFVTDLIALYVTVLVSLSAWYVHVTGEARSRLEKEMSSFAPTRFNLDDKQWCARVATQWFCSRPTSERISLAEGKLQSIRHRAVRLGYDLDALSSWLYETAIHFQRYPLRTYGTSEPVIYRDLTNSGFPKPHPFKLFLKTLISGFSGCFLGVSMIVVPLSCAPMLLSVMIVQAFRGHLFR